MVVAALSTVVVAGPTQAATPEPGFTISGLGRVASGNGADAAVVHDSVGRRHLLTVDMVGGHARLTYRVRLHGAGSSQRIRIPVSGPKPRVFETLSPDGIHVYAAVVACNGIWTAEARVKQRRLSVFGRAVAGTKSCSTARYRATLDAFIALPGGRIAILGSPAYGPGSTPPEGAAIGQVYAGVPGGRLTLVKNQPSEQYDGSLAGDSALALDSSTGQLVYARVTPAADQEEIHVQVGPPDVAWSSTVGWSAPTLAATLPSAYTDLSLSASAGNVAIAVSRHADSVTPVTASPLPGFQLLEGTEGGAWQRPSAPPYIDNADVQATVGLAGDGRLSIGFGRCTSIPHDNRAPGAVYTQIRTASGFWARPLKRSSKQRIEVDWVLPGRQRVGFRTFSASAPGKFHGACA